MTHLLVPIDVDALIERTPGEVYADVGFATPDRTVTRAARQLIAPEPFADRGPRERGVHLLWAVPDALARFDTDRGRFPRLPCRWLVVRTASGATPGSRVARAWALADIHRTPVTVVELPASIPAATGRADVDITGPDHADPSWHAFYDNVTDRLAFHDDLADDPTGPLNYLVCGWYQRIDHDPIRRGGANTSEAALRLRLAQLGWTLPGSIPDLPTKCLFHGAVAAVGWPDAGWPGDGGGALAPEIDRRPTAADLEIGLGDRTAEVLGELLGDGSPESGPLLELLIGGEIAELDEPGGEFRAARNAHRDRFAVAATPDNARQVVFTPTKLAEPAEQLPPAPLTPSSEPDVDPGELSVVHVPTPRSYLPNDPQLVLAGAGRSYRHGEDGRFDPLGLLPCRLSGDCVTVLGRPGETDGVGADALPRTTSGKLDLPTSRLSAALRADVDALLVELQALDPAVTTAQPGSTAPDPLADLRLDWLWAQAELALAGVAPTTPVPDVRTDGVSPAPIAVSLPAREWDPLVLDWTMDWTPSPRGAHDWTLDDLDFEPVGPPGDAPPVPIRGRAILTSAPAQALADAIERALDALDAGDSSGAVGAVVDDLVTALDASDRADLVARLRHADLVAARLDGFLARLRGVPAGTWIDSGGIVGAPEVIAAAERRESYRSTPLVAGTYAVGRLRLVDAFGRTLVIEPGAATTTLSSDVRHPLDPAVALQRPRFTAPATLEFRYVDPQATGDLSLFDVSSAGSPLMGFFVPNLFDTSLELHDAAGGPWGLLELDSNARAVWVGTPGLQERAGLSPAAAIGTRTRAQQLIGAVVDGLLAADANRPGADAYDSVLSELLRAIDAARFGIDVAAVVGDRYPQALLGAPAVILRARARVRVDDPQAPPDRPVSVPVRLGSFGEIRDGLLGYYLAEQPDRLHLVHPEQGVDIEADRPGAPDPSGLVWVRQDTDLDLVVLMTPGADITITSGLTPGKVIWMPREWIDQSMARLAPTLRFDAVLREPNAVRIPVSADVHGRWDWAHRAAPDRWELDEVAPPAPGQLDPTQGALVQDGYLRLTLAPDETYVSTPYTIVGIRRGGPTRRIEMVRVRSASGRETDLHIDEAVLLASSGRVAYHTQVAGFPEVQVVVDTTPAGRAFLRTDTDQTTGNNLSSLPRF